MKFIETTNAPKAVGPYSQAIHAGDWVFCSGQISQEGNVAQQTTQILKNLAAVLAAAGATLNNVVKATVYLTDMNDFVAMNEVYAQAFGAHRPARACIQAARLPKDVQVEMDAIAYLGK